MKKYKKYIFIICPVRNITKKENIYLQNYVKKLEEKNYLVHFPPRDTKQNDKTGLNICNQNKKAIKKADEIHVYWSNNSEGRLFDFGMAFMANKPFVLINNKQIKKTSRKGFHNVLIQLNSQNKNQ